MQTEDEMIGPLLSARGRIDDAIRKCSNIWASFPGNNYGQNPHKLDKLIAEWNRLAKA